MKKIILLCISLLFLTGCTSIEKKSLDNLTSEIVNSKVTTTNVNRNGYRYYLPKGLCLKKSSSFNEIFTDQKYYYYLYVDVVRFHNQVSFNYKTNTDAYYSKALEIGNKQGYIEINNYKNNQYLIEIMYNYAKIEVVVYEEDIKSSVAYAMVVLSSVTYNDYVIEKYLTSSVIDSIEEEFDIFEIVGSDHYLEFAEEEASSTEVKDPDYIN